MGWQNKAESEHLTKLSQTFHKFSEFWNNCVNFSGIKLISIAMNIKWVVLQIEYGIYQESSCGIKQQYFSV